MVMRPNRSLIPPRISALASSNKEIARALPTSKGGEPAGQLQTYRTDVYTYFTKKDGKTELLYSAENWVRIKLTLETTGPVAVGTVASLVSPTAGHGITLDTAVPFETYLAKGTRFYIIADAISRVNIVIEPIPWLEQIDFDTVTTERSVRDAVVDIGKSIVNAISALRGGPQIPTSSPSPAPNDRKLLPRLTSMRPGRR
jgi:hypothetical protein